MGQCLQTTSVVAAVAAGITMGWGFIGAGGGGEEGRLDVL
jgi:hypothetical protein